MDNKNRQTGRTTKILKRAITAALNGYYVFVIAHDDRYAKQLAKMAQEILIKKFKVTSAVSPQTELFIHRRQTGSLRFISANRADVCLETFPYCVRGHAERCFVDHVVWEQFDQKKRQERELAWFKEFNAAFPITATGFLNLGSLIQM